VYHSAQYDKVQPVAIAVVCDAIAAEARFNAWFVANKDLAGGAEEALALCDIKFYQ